MIVMPKARRLVHVLWRICHWLLMVSPLLVLIVGLASFFTPIRYKSFSELDHVTVDLVDERVYFAYLAFSDPRAARGWEVSLRHAGPPVVAEFSYHYTLTFCWNEPKVLSLVPPLLDPEPPNYTYTIWLTEITFPLWVIFLLLAVYPAFVFYRGPLRRRRRRAKMQCVACGYDLTANVSGVCPECGFELDELQRKLLAGEDRSAGCHGS